MKRIILLCTAVCLLLWGCGSTTVILPPESSGTVVSSEVQDVTTVPVTEPSAEKTQPSETTVPLTEPSSAPETTAAPTSRPTEAPTSQSTAAPETAPSSEATEPDVYDIYGHSIGSLELSLLSELNAQRTAAGLQALSIDRTLSALAAIRACECSTSFSHIRPDGRNGLSVLSDYGIGGWARLEESILYGTDDFTAAEIADTLMYSQKDNILDVDFTHAGIGIYCCNGRIYITVIFAG